MNNLLRILIIACGAFGIQFSALAQWTDVSVGSNSSVQIFDIDFHNEQLGAAVGIDNMTKSGHIFVTEDGGATWSEKKYSNSHLTSVVFLDENNILVGGNDTPPGSMIKLITSNDKGQTWTETTSTTYTGVNAMEFLNDQVGFAIGYGTMFGANAGFMSTSDGGATWNYLMDSPLELAEAMDFVDENIGYIGMVDLMTNDGKIIKTIDGGQTFSVSFGGDWIRDINFLDANTGYALTGLNNRDLYKTTDGGNTWNRSDIPDDAASITFFTADIGIALTAGDKIHKTEDGGATWATTTNGLGKGGSAAERVGRFLYSGGLANTVIKYEHGIENPSSIVQIAEGEEAVLYPNPMISGQTLNFKGLNNGNAKLTISNQVGQIVWDEAIVDQQVPFLNLQPGIYHYSLTSTSGIQEGKLVIR